MSKSLGNVVDPQKLVAAYGAEILRLWVAMVDYREDMRFSDEILKRCAEAYRKIRNTCRVPAREPLRLRPRPATRVPEAQLEQLDRYALQRHRQLVARVRAAYEAYEFHVVYHQLVQYCVGRPLGLLPRRAQGPALLRGGAPARRRRSAQTVLQRMARRT